MWSLRLEFRCKTRVPTLGDWSPKKVPVTSPLVCADLYAGWLTNLPRFQGARPDHVRVESSCCFPRELVSFDQGHVTRFPPIGKRIWVGRHDNYCLFFPSPSTCSPQYRHRNQPLIITCHLPRMPCKHVLIIQNSRTRFTVSWSSRHRNTSIGDLRTWR